MTSLRSSSGDCDVESRKWGHGTQARGSVQRCRSRERPGRAHGQPSDGQKLSALVDELFGIEDGSMTPAQADRVDQIVAELSELDRSAVPWIRERLESDLSQNLRGPLDGVNRYQRERVLCEVIGRIGGSEAFGLLADLLMREVSFWEYETVRLGAARGLGYLGDKRAIPLLQQRQQRGATTPYVMQAYEEALQALAA